MWATPRATPVRKPEEVHLIDGMQDLDKRSLDDLVFQHRDAQLSLFRFMCYTVPPRTGGTHYDRFTVCRCAVSPDRVSGFHQPDARGISDPDPALRGRVPGAYGGVALRWDTPDGPPIYRLQELPFADTGRSPVLPPDLPQDLRPPGGAWAPVWHAPGQSQSVDPRAPARAAGRPAHPR